MLNELTSNLLDDWDRFFPSLQRAGSVHYLGIPGSVEGGTTTFLAFGGKQVKPFCSVKIHRHPNEDGRAHNEHMVLQQIQSLEGELASSVPRSILVKKIGDHWVLVQSILEGIPMTVSLTAEGRPEITLADRNIGRVSDWLVRLHEGTSSGSDGRRERLLQRLSKTVEEFVSIFDLSTEEKRFAVSSLKSLQFILKPDIPVQHGDLCRQNILVDTRRDQTRLNIIDWTDSLPEGCPFHDLFCFLSTYFLQVRKAVGIRGFVAAFEDTFLNKNPLSDVVGKWILHYGNRLGWAPESIRIFITLFLMEQSMFEYHKLLKYSRQGGLPRFTLTLASLAGRNYQDAFKEQLWIYFFRVFAKQHRQFIL